MDRPKKQVVAQKKTESGPGLTKRDYFFMIACAVVLVICGPYVYYSVKIYRYMEANSETMAGPDFVFPKWHDLWITLVSALCIYVSKKVIIFVMQPVLFKLSKKVEKESEELFRLKAGKSAIKFQSTFWHIFASVYAWIVLRNQTWLPWYLGGEGELINGFTNMPFQPIDQSVYVFGLITLGNPLEASLEHFFWKEKNPDFAEMALHHVVQLSLVSASVLGNCLNIGTMIAFLHDVSDIGIQLAKMLHLMGYNFPWSLVSFLFGQVAWLYLRLFCLPTLIHAYG